MKDLCRKIIRFFRLSFLPPKELNWGYPLFIMAVGLLTMFICKTQLTDLPFSPTSLVFASLVVPLTVLISLIVPAISLSSSDNRLANAGFTGRYTGIGPILIAFFSGVPLSLFGTACHNLSAYLWLRLGRTMPFPAFMCYNLDGSLTSVILEVLTQSVIPAIGISIFFTGVMWSLFREENKGIGSVVIIIAFVLYQLNPVDTIGLIAVGWWLLTLRKKTGNIYAPFFALVAMKITQVSFSFILPYLDTTTLQTYSDIPSTIFYSSVPSLFVALILFAFFKSALDEFERIYHSDLLGRDNDETNSVPKEEIPLPFISGINPALLIAVIILLVLWGILIF